MPCVHVCVCTHPHTPTTLEIQEVLWYWKIVEDGSSGLAIILKFIEKLSCEDECTVNSHMWPETSCGIGRHIVSFLCKMSSWGESFPISSPIIDFQTSRPGAIGSHGDITRRRGAGVLDTRRIYSSKPWPRLLSFCPRCRFYPLYLLSLNVWHF